MRLYFRRFPSCHSWPCKCTLVIVIMLLSLEISYLFEFLHQISKRPRGCLNLRKIARSIEKYPIHKQQNVPKLSSKPLNWISFNFTAQPQTNCSNYANIAFVVHSKAENFAHRSYFRNVHLKNWHLNRKKVKVLFVVFDNSTHHDKLLAESGEFDDLLIVGGIDEHYHNITHKTRAWISWLESQCKNIEIVFKCDDDIQLNIEELMNMFELFNNQQSLVLCRLFYSGQVVRNPKSKWFLSKNEYKPSDLGTYCQGMAYAFSGNLLKQMVKNMRKVQFLWMDDWYVTHVLLNSTNVTYVDIGKHYISTNNVLELSKILQKNSTLHHEPIFGHFRSTNQSYTLTQSSDIWHRIQKLSCN